MKKLWPGKALAPKITMALIILFLLLWALVPFYFMVVIPLGKPGSPVIGIELPRGEISLEYFKHVLFSKNNIVRYIINSFLTCGIATIGALIIATPAAYAISRWKKGLSTGVYLTYFVLRMFPPITLAIPYYMIFSSLNLIDTRLALIIVYTPYGLPLAIWLLKGFFDVIPVSMEEAAEIDGAAGRQIFTKIVLPLIIPGVAVSGSFVFLTCYVEYIFALTFTLKTASTYPLYVTGFIGEFHVWVGELVAASLIGMIPLVLLYLGLQKYIRKGISFGAV